MGPQIGAHSPLYQRLTEQFRQQILSGVLAEGEQLPSVRELAGRLTINPNTIARAYRELEAGGWIASVAGKGSFVCSVPGSDEGQLLEEFDRVCAALKAAGFTEEALVARLQGGNDYA